jgi:hypothetical protein
VIVSLHKKGDATVPGNYRPITLLPVMDKLYMSVLAARLQKYVPLHDHQFAFRARRGTVDAVFAISETVRVRAAQGKPTYAFFQDMAKAYDSVWHSGLLYKLHSKGVRGRLWHVIRAAYANARSAPRLQHTVGERFAVERGVAQGCPLSPILFDIVIDDLLSELNDRPDSDGVPIGEMGAGGEHAVAALAALAYADDVSALSATPEGLQRIIDRMARHAVLWKWDCNVTKSVCMAFGPQTGAPPPTWRWRQRQLRTVDEVKVLGVYLQSDCSWARQCEYASLRVNQMYHVWKPVLSDRNICTRTKLHVVNTFIKPVAAYGMELWDGVGAGTRGTEAFARLEKSLARILRGALALPQGAGRQHCRSALLQADTGIRTFADDAVAARLRYLRNLGSGREGIAVVQAVLVMSRSVAQTAPALTSKTWWGRADGMKRTVQIAAGVDDLLTAPAAEGPAAAPTPGPPAQVSNAAISAAVRCAARAAAAVRSSLLSSTQALVQAAQAGPAPYLCHTRGLQSASVFALRAQVLPELLSPAVPLPSGGPDEPAHLRCPACARLVSDEFMDEERCFFQDWEMEAARRQRMFCHRVTSCAAHVRSRVWFRDELLRILGYARAGWVLPGHAVHAPPRDEGAAMLAVLLDPMSCPHLREGLTTGGGGPAFYHALHHYLRSLRVPDASVWPLPVAYSHTFGNDSDADSDDEVDLRGSLSLPPVRRARKAAVRAVCG